MENLYELVYDLLGKDESHELFRLLPTKLEDPSIINLENEHSRQYLYPKLGILLALMTGCDCFVSAALHLTDSTTEFGNLSRYQGKLPNRINPSDGPDEVEAKMGQQPIDTENCPAYFGETATLWNYYRLSEVFWGFGFSENKLRLVTLTRFPSSK